MLYPKREKDFTPEDFLSPSSEYRGTPFGHGIINLIRTIYFGRSINLKKWDSAVFICMSEPEWRQNI
jgi:hypothetical protein